MEKAFNDMQQIKRRLFAMRNGVIADVLRKGGSRFTIIFGVNIPQLAEIAAETGPDRDLAERLWANTTTRESMLIAPMLVPADGFSRDDAERWFESVPDVEVADILCHRLLRKLPYALDLCSAYADSDDDLRRYTAMRLMCNIAADHPFEARAMARRELARDCRLTRSLAQLLITNY